MALLHKCILVDFNYKGEMQTNCLKIKHQTFTLREKEKKENVNALKKMTKSSHFKMDDLCT